jgi:ankyrin repeat protein
LLREGYRGRDYSSFAVVAGLGLVWGKAIPAARTSASQSSETRGQIGLNNLSENEVMTILGFLELSGKAADVEKSNLEGTTALIMASSCGHGDVVKQLLNSGAEMNKARIDGMTPLMWASYGGKVDAARLLLNSGAEMNSVGGTGKKSALTWAVIGGRVSTVTLLVKAGANVHIQDQHGITALAWAQQIEESPSGAEIVRILTPMSLS